jgi:hypothetical protein
VKFPKEFAEDLKEAHAFWQTVTKDGKLVTKDQWIMMLVSKPVYEILRQKRTMISDAEEKGR